jgi:CelD/BcsL family acetyltransferase involved in cellulose biosynthesis
MTSGLVVGELAEPAWDAAVAALPGRTVFHHSGWLNTLTESYGARLHRLAVHDGGACVAVWPVLVVRKGPLRVTGSPLAGWNTPYLGPVLAPGADPAAVVAAVMATPIFRRASYAEVRVSAAEAGVDLSADGFERSLDFETLVLDLAPGGDALWTALPGKTRNTVRKGEKNGFEVVVEDGDEFVDDFIAMATEVFGRWGKKPPFDRSFLATAVKRLAPAGQLTAFTARRDGVREATIVFLHDDVTAYYWMGASFDRVRSLAPNSLLLWEAIRWSADHGLGRVDFVSASGNAGDFKRGFGPTPMVASQHWTRSRSGIEAFMKDTYARLARRRRTNRGPVVGRPNAVAASAPE